MVYCAGKVFRAQGVKLEGGVGGYVGEGGDGAEGDAVVVDREVVSAGEGGEGACYGGSIIQVEVAMMTR